MTTYIPNPKDTRDIVLPPSILDLAEKLAENAHDVWAEQRIKEGWRYGLQRDDKDKKHPCLKPYDELPESEKEYDRRTAIETLKLIVSEGYQIVAPK